MYEACHDTNEKKAAREYDAMFQLRIQWTYRVVDAGGEEMAWKLGECPFWVNVNDTILDETKALIFIPTSRDWFGEHLCAEGFPGFLYAYANVLSCLYKGQPMQNEFQRALATNQFATE